MVQARVVSLGLLLGLSLLAQGCLITQMPGVAPLATPENRAILGEEIRREFRELMPHLTTELAGKVGELAKDPPTTSEEWGREAKGFGGAALIALLAGLWRGYRNAQVQIAGSHKRTDTRAREIKDADKRITALEKA